MPSLIFNGLRRAIAALDTKAAEWADRNAPKRHAAQRELEERFERLRLDLEWLDSELTITAVLRAKKKARVASSRAKRRAFHIARSEKWEEALGDLEEIFLRRATDESHLVAYLAYLRDWIIIALRRLLKRRNRISERR
jgi:hypothetical protein